MNKLSHLGALGKSDPRSGRALRQAAHLAKCGPRPILEALLAVQSGQPVDVVLRDFCRLSPETYHATLYFYADDEVAA